jgi:hypothetical protein
MVKRQGKVMKAGMYAPGELLSRSISAIFTSPLWARRKCRRDVVKGLARTLLATRLRPFPSVIGIFSSRRIHEIIEFQP